MVSDFSRPLREAEAGVQCHRTGPVNVIAGGSPGLQIEISMSEKMCLVGTAVVLRGSNDRTDLGFRKGEPIQFANMMV